MSGVDRGSVNRVNRGQRCISRARLLGPNADAAKCAIIVTGWGASFSSGGNLKHMRDREGIFAGDAAQVREGYRAGIQRLAKALHELEVPTIAAVNGAAYGAGCDTALACHQTQDHHEAVQAFFDKRPPRFTGE